MRLFSSICRKLFSLPVLIAVFTLSMGSFLYFVLLVVPFERTQGVVQKIFFFHVPSANLMYLGFLIGLVYSLKFLIKRKPCSFRTAYGAIEVGFLFGTVVLVSGPIWARPNWGVWWSGEPRLTAVLIMWLAYLAYLYIGATASSDARARILSSIVAVVSFVLVPVIHYSVVLWRGVHPQIKDTPGGLPVSMRGGLYLSFLTFGVLFVILLKLNLRRLKLQERIQEAEIQARLRARRS